TAESEQREVFHPGVDTAPDHAAHRLDAAPMAGHARQAPAPGPAAVAIHDDGDVTRDFPGRRDVDSRAHEESHGASVRRPSSRLLSRAAPCRSRRSYDP